MSARLIPVPDGLVGMRADQALAKLFGVSRSKAVTLIETGQIAGVGFTLDKSSRLEAGAVLDVDIADEPAPGSEITPVEGMRIVYDDDDVVVIDKPAGVAAHTGPGWSGPTVVGALRYAGYRISTSGPPEREGIVQRLDVGTSGLMVVAKSERAYSVLKQAFRDRTVNKIYHALVQGHIDPPSGTIEAPIGRHPSREFKMCVLQGGKPAITHYDTLEVTAKETLLKIKLETGRTHQIRVHFAALGHPCVGDPTYGEADPSGTLVRQWLHAVELGFAHPVTGRPLHFSSQYPDDLQTYLQRSRHVI